VLSNPEITYQVARARLDELLAEAAHERTAEAARRAAPGFVPASRLRDTAFWATIIGPIVGLGFVVYFIRAITNSLA
jgi:hypothetical protein